MAESSRRPRARRPAPPPDRARTRAFGVASVAGLLVILIVVIAMIGGSGGDPKPQSSAATATATPTPRTTATPTPSPTPVPLTPAQRQQRTAAAALVRSRGFKVVRLSDYDPKATLRVLIGRSDSGSEFGFFFANGDYLGNDSTDPSVKVSVKRTGDLQVTLEYGIFQPGDAPDKPTGSPIVVRFRWDGTQLTPIETLPSPQQRTPGRQ